MIDGVNLITTEAVNISSSFFGNLFPAIVSAIGCIVAIIMLVLSIKEKEWGVLFLCVIFGIALGFISFFCFNEAFNPRYEERYLVQLDDKISSEFIDKYDIVERKGNNVYVIKERDTND